MLNEQLKDHTEGLYYLTESDAPVSVFTGGYAEKVDAEALQREIRNQLDTENSESQDTPAVINGADPGKHQYTNFQEQTLDEFFTNPTRIREGAGQREIDYATRFINLKELLEKNLTDIKVFKIGDSKLDVYIVGLDRDGNLSGVQTQATQT